MLLLQRIDHGNAGFIEVLHAVGTVGGTLWIDIEITNDGIDPGSNAVI